MQWVSHPKMMALGRTDGKFHGQRSFETGWSFADFTPIWTVGPSTQVVRWFFRDTFGFWMCLDQPDFSAAWSAIPWFFAFSVMKKSLTHFLLHPKK